jgi:tetratricopeptide (TPR) repeat protein
MLRFCQAGQTGGRARIMNGKDKSLVMTLEAEFNEAHSLLAAGKLGDSAKLARDLVRRHPTIPQAWYLLSSVYLRAKQHPQAIACAERALTLAPHDPMFLLQLGQCLIATGRRREALQVADRATAMSLYRADWNDALGTLLTFCEEPVRALPFFTRAVDLAPQDSNFLYNLATAQRMNGDLDAAETNLNRVIAMRPNDIQAYYTRADLRTQSPVANHIDEMTRLIQRGLQTPLDEITLCFAIAKELEDVHRHEESFEYLKRGCDLQRRHIRYNVAEDTAVLDRVIQIYDRASLDRSMGFETDECIFVVGLPRSGTTLVERILASHSEVQAAGELQAFPLETLKAVRRQAGGSLTDSDFLQRALSLDARALGHAYIDATRPQTGKTSRFVDKLPINYLYAGLIRCALPRARIVALARDPMDSCYAMYKTLFVGAYPFSYDLSELGLYYAAWHRLMRHWQSVLGDNLLVVQYEDLVVHQEEVSRRILAHCGLDWQDTCLTFQNQKNAVTTASATQVRQAMYSSSVGKWRFVQRELRPLADELDRHEPESGWRLGTRR